MEISISLKSHAENKVAHLVALLQSMDFIENIKIKSDTTPKVETARNRFDKYNGIWKNKLSNDEIDLQLNIIRNEWEQAI
jgi:hypothetical protein